MRCEGTAMTKIDIFSGFLGAGKTTLIKKLIAEAYRGEKLVLIENEFGQIGVDGAFLKDSGIEITEMNSGCICCSLVGDFGKALREVLDRFHPDRILIEPSGVGKLSDVAEAVLRVGDDVCVNSLTTVVDAGKCRIYAKNFGEFFNNQIESAKTVVLSHTAKCDEERLAECVDYVKEHNPGATLVTADWNLLPGSRILEVMERDGAPLAEDLAALREQALLDEAAHAGHHHHHDHDDDDDDDDHDHDGDEDHDHGHNDDDRCGCDHDDHGEDHDHDNHDDDDHDHNGDEDHDHDGDHGHGHHHHHHHGDGEHDADEVFDSVGIETARKFAPEEISAILEELQTGSYGTVLRAKGVVDSGGEQWIHFDYVPGEPDVRRGPADIGGRVCVIGTDIHADEVRVLFR